MWTIISLAISWLIKDPIVQAVAKNLLKVLIEKGKSLVPLALASIKNASIRTDLTGLQKLELVTDTIMAEAPGVEKAVVVSVVTSVYAAVVSEKVPEVPSNSRKCCPNILEVQK